MKTLIKYEIKKIITKKSILFTFPLILLFVLWLFILPFFQENITLPSGESYRGMKAVKILKKQPDIHLNAQEVNRLIAKYQNLAKDKKNYPNGDPSQIEFKNGINHSFVLPNYEALNLIANVHSGAKRYVGHPEIRNIKTSKKTFNLYKKLGTNYHDIENGRKLNSSRYYSTSEKRYWENMVKKIKTPFKIGYQGAWRIIIDRLTFLFVPILFICILVSQAFIYDIQLRTITIIFPTMKGRRELVIAKLLSAYLVGVVYYSLFVFLVTVPLLSLYGIKGWDLPIQVQDPSIPYPWTLSQTVFIHFGIGLLILLGLITIILLSSLFVKKKYTDYHVNNLPSSNSYDYS
ncbi:hypothetical protein QQG09_07910 [Melissococcus plutonius]|uniref:Uncharacterized protein n=1 Tax=Melissococcus plutonius TaxID=33970 RepID=A0A2Z5Y4S8_9ENTE|nr:hypothetical protein [Melissococcus plutonius]MCV2498965.1 hypothetical protein [Melissococcus plutonius]MCV2501726.1 hypothetical protein [Melissococcus plutonius]MCV2505413.1 hypothetical protein [Melissococcus plutonius]MCV2507760.1 hypothetical protein [Melissococcus plutonius]MCV2520144.1 hypothetical protein [Melissococcus plutonius]